MHRIPRLATMYACIGLALVGEYAARCQERKEDPGARPLMSMMGRNSQIKKSKLLRITTDAAWRALWLEHKTGSMKPKDVPEDLEWVHPEFDKVMAIAVFEGQGINCRGYSAHSIHEVDGKIRVRLDAHTYQSGIDTPTTQAWGILILPRSSKEVVIERDVRTLIDDPPSWKEWKRFPAIPDK